MARLSCVTVADMLTTPSSSDVRRGFSLPPPRFGSVVYEASAEAGAGDGAANADDANAGTADGTSGDQAGAADEGADNNKSPNLDVVTSELHHPV